MSHSTDTSHARDALRALHSKIEKRRDAAKHDADKAASIPMELHCMARQMAYDEAMAIINLMEHDLLMQDMENTRKGVAA